MRWIAVALLAVLVGGCTGKEGPMGPAGPAGANGADGVDGAPGSGGDGALQRIISWHNDAPLQGDDTRVPIDGWDRITAGQIIQFVGYIALVFPGDAGDVGTLVQLPAIVQSPEGNPVQATFGVTDDGFYRFLNCRGAYVAGVVFVFDRPGP